MKIFDPRGQIVDHVTITDCTMDDIDGLDIGVEVPFNTRDADLGLKYIRLTGWYRPTVNNSGFLERHPSQNWYARSLQVIDEDALDTYLQLKLASL